MLKRETHSKCCRLTVSTRVLTSWVWLHHFSLKVKQLFDLTNFFSTLVILHHLKPVNVLVCVTTHPRPEASNKEQQVTVVMEPNRLQQERERWSVFVPTEGSRCVFSPLPPSPPHFNRTSVHHSRKLLSGPALYHIHSIIIISVWCVTK